MISEGPGFLLRHRSGRYYLSELVHFGTDRVTYAPGTYAAVHSLVSSPFAATIIYSSAHWEKHLESPEWADVADQFEVVSGPGCSCCGERGGSMWGNEGNWRCEKHRQRHACAIEGCKRTTTTKHPPSSEVWMCGDHWRLYVPPRSLRRRTYQAFWRKAKKLGATGGDDWPDQLERQFWRFWETLIANARHKATGGNLDLATIERMFGV